VLVVPEELHRLGSTFRHCRQLKNEQRELWKAAGRATGWKAGRCRHVQIPELFSREKYDQVVMDFLAATEVGKFSLLPTRR